MKYGLALLMAITIGAGIAVTVACNDEVDVIPSCGEIPTGGCPKNGDTCTDLTCAAVYTCTADGTWLLQEKCPLHEGGLPDAGTADAAPDALPERDASFLQDVPGPSGGPGCEDLEQPDCPLSRMEYCPANQCCQCEDLYYCQSGGWQIWGSCNDGGALVKEP